MDTWPGLRKSQDFVTTNRAVFERSREAIMAKINENEAGRRCLGGHSLADAERLSQQCPDFSKVPAKLIN